MNIVDKSVFLNFFNDSGYVFDFTNSSFDSFTIGSVGLSIRTKYGLSKGKSLGAFADEACESDVVKLFSDLLQYYEDNLLDNNINTSKRQI